MRVVTVDVDVSKRAFYLVGFNQHVVLQKRTSPGASMLGLDLIVEKRHIVVPQRMTLQQKGP